MSALGTKLLRDLVRIRGQALTIALVVASGIAGFVSLKSTYASLLDARDRYYLRERMPDLFVSATRVPEPVAARLARIEGVASAETRIVGEVRVRLPYELDPPSGRVHSLPDRGEPMHASLRLRDGRLPDAEREGEAVLLEPFAVANDIAVGDTLDIVVRGVARRVRITGIVMSPEYVMSVAAGEITPDPARFPVLFLRRGVLAPMLDLEGAFNAATFAVARGASAEIVARRVERLLEPWGAYGVVTLAHQPSNFMLEGELSQLRGLATVVPFLFLAVSTFLLHVVSSRILHLQRSQIATLRAVGYSSIEVGVHYLGLVAVIVVAGSLLGVGIGAWLGRNLTDLYVEYFHFPDRVYRLDAQTVTVAVLFGAVSAFVGALSTVVRIVRLPPAEAMQPEAPALYRRSFVDLLAGGGLVSPAALMVLREVTRRPLRVLVSSLGIAFAIAIVVVGRFGHDSMQALLALQFHDTLREDMTISFTRARSTDALEELAAIPGVIRVEGVRITPIRVTRGRAFRDTVMLALPSRLTLRGLYDRDDVRVPLPSQGLLISTKLAEVLGVRVGDRLELRFMEDERRTLHWLVAAVIDDAFGLFVYTSSHELERMTGQRSMVSSALLRVDPAREDDVLRTLRDKPLVAQVTRKRILLERFEAQSGEQMRTFTLVLSVFAAVIAVGVIYNDARIALSMRSHELASLRVLGFTRGEISFVLLGELFIRVVLGVPVGLVLGRDWTHRIAATVDPETYRMPITISSETYLLATGIAVASALVTALLVRRRLDSLDLVAVLKSHT